MPGIHVGDDAIVFSQSWLGTFENCPEQARLEMVGQLPRTESDATAMGTAGHAAIEAVLNGASLTEGEAVALDTFHDLTQLPEFKWVSIKTPETAERTLIRMYWTWANEVWPQLTGVWATEYPFEFDLNATSPSGKALRIRGSIDEIDDHTDINDWKFAGLRNWSQSSADRKIQPTVYLMALQREFPDEANDRVFNFVVMDKQSQSHGIFTTRRTEADYRWLTEKARRISALIEANLDHWPLSPADNILCSPKWCSAWDKCRGQITSV